MKTLRLFALTLLFIHATNSFAQDGIQHLASPSVTTTSVKKESITYCAAGQGSTTDYFEEGFNGTGWITWTNYDSNNKCYNNGYADYISCYKFTLSIPANAIITSIRIQEGTKDIS